jgi:hypothetical protein
MASIFDKLLQNWPDYGNWMRLVPAEYHFQSPLNCSRMLLKYRLDLPGNTVGYLLVNDSCPEMKLSVGGSAVNSPLKYCLGQTVAEGGPERTWAFCLLQRV